MPLIELTIEIEVVAGDPTWTNEEAGVVVVNFQS